MPREYFKQNYSLVSIKIEMDELEKDMRDLFHLPVVNDVIVSIYMGKLKRLEQLSKFKTSFYKK